MAEPRREPIALEKGPGDTGSITGESEADAADILVLVSTSSNHELRISCYATRTEH